LVKESSRARSLAAGFVKRLLHHSGWSAGHVRRLGVNFIITFHVVPPEKRGFFRKAVEFLARNFHVVPLDQIVETIEGQTSNGKRGLVAITFDDGLRNHSEVAYPILKELKVPAIFYICPELVDHPGSIWTWELHSRLERLSERERQPFFKAAGVSDRIQSIIDWMKTIPVDQREQVERNIRSITPDFRFTEFERDQFDLMSWNEIERLDPAIITIGSHTATHIDLPQAQPERLERELSRSKEILESRLNRKIQHFAYPNGNVIKELLPVVRQFYRSAVTTRPGVVRYGDNPLLLNRIHAEFDLSLFSWQLAVTAHRGKPS
jgi:peptidoglycan/xylan/chitin deacetylase (PgdA/CDA1 family)